MAGAGDGASPMDTTIIIYLVLLFVSSQGEAYFPDIMVINGMDTKANWLVIADALGNMLAVVVPTQVGWRDIPCRMAFIPSMADLSAKAFLLGGIALASAQTKSILYNSCIVWSAIISKFILGRVLSWMQWSGVGLLILGCIIKIDFSSGSGEGSNTLLGIIFILIGCVLHSLTNVVNEHYIRKYDFPPSKLCCLIGTINLSVWMFLFVIGFIIPEMAGKGEDAHWVYKREDFDVTTMADKNPDTPMSNAWAWFGFVVSSTVHAVAYFNLLGSIGVVSCGVMKGLTTAGYVTLSAIVFCSIRDKYCPNFRTVMSALVCVAGVMVYSYASSLGSPARQPSVHEDNPNLEHRFTQEISLESNVHKNQDAGGSFSNQA